MKFPWLRLPDAVTAGGVFRFASLSLYAMLLLHASLSGKGWHWMTAAMPALLCVTALVRHLRADAGQQNQLWLLGELAAAMFAVAVIALHNAIPSLALPWLVGLAGLFPLVLEAATAFLVIAALCATGLTLHIVSGVSASDSVPYLFATLFAGLSTILLSHVMQHGHAALRIRHDFAEQPGHELREHATPHDRASMNRALRFALERNELSVVYQPKVSILDGSLKGFESLLRWNSAKYGHIPPVEFIPLAESSGLVIPIGLWVLEQACKQFSGWQTQYPETRQLTISVNISMRQLLHHTFIEEVAAILKRTGVPPQSVELELTETTAMTSPVKAIENMRRLKDLGLRLALDDFGTGYSSLAYLQKLPLDVLKIDKAFVQKLDTSVNDLEIVRTILALAHTLNFETVAEGVETKENVAQLKKMGCYLAQGFVFSEAVNAETAEDMLRTPRRFAVA
jgi:EAL domain-containing protein (putative c-di-GMP-specific phosphodiesterase class I)